MLKTRLFRTVPGMTALCHPEVENPGAEIAAPPPAELAFRICQSDSPPCPLAERRRIVLLKSESAAARFLEPAHRQAKTKKDAQRRKRGKAI